MTAEMLARFWSKVDTSAGPTACWPWTAGLSSRGYGQFYVGAKPTAAHRVAYELAEGPLPSGTRLVRAEGCVQLCVNPLHWEAMTWGPLRERLYSQTTEGVAPPHAPELGPCLLWTGVMDPRSLRGRIKVNGKPRAVYVVAWELENGPAPEGLQADHLCRVPQCMRPSHIEMVTAQVNCLRRSAASPRLVCKRGHALEGDNVYLVKSTGSRHCRACQVLRDRARGRNV